jgi:hypothetical protein
MVKQKVKNLAAKSVDTKYTGLEPEWTVPVADDQRKISVMRTFQWYNYHCDKKTAKQCVLDWLLEHRPDQHRAFARVPDSAVPSQLGWLCRMAVRGWQLDQHELTYIDSTVNKHVAADHQVKQVVEAATPDVERVTIQDRLRARAEEIAGELEGMYDDLVRADCKLTADFKPMAVIRGMNLAPQMTGLIRDVWQARLEELQEVQSTADPDLVVGYGNFTKTQLRNLIKFTEQVLADCGSYVQIKRVERKPRKKKAVSPEQTARKFKIMPAFEEFKLVSEPAARLVNSSEAWLYDTKKRKVIHVVADAHIGTFTVKNNGLVGIDEANSHMKTLRKPAEQLRALMTASWPNSRKYFKDIRATEVRYNGRGSEHIVILRVK